MWSTDTRWFDVSIVMSIFAIGNILFGRFEEHKPRRRRLLKLAVFLGATLLLATFAGRAWAYGLLALPLPLVLWVHAVWLPRHGISGWTAEPRRRYLALMRMQRPRGKRDGAAPVASGRGRWWPDPPSARRTSPRRRASEATARSPRSR